MASDGQVVFEVELDGRTARANLRDITNAIERESRQWARDVNDSASSMQTAFSRALDRFESY